MSSAMSSRLNVSADLTRSENLLRQLQSTAGKSKQETLTRLWAVLRYAAFGDR